MVPIYPIKASNTTSSNVGSDYIARFEPDVSQRLRTCVQKP